MSDQSSIEWTDATWNPVSGCSKVSPGLREPEPPRATPEAARAALATYMRRWSALARWYAVHEAEVHAGRWAALMWHLWVEVYALDPDAARGLVREVRT